jgi:hypothetical protein
MDIRRRYIICPRSFYMPNEAMSFSAGTHPWTSATGTSVQSEDVNERDKAGRDESGKHY